MPGATQVPKDESRANKIYNRALECPVNEKAFFLEAGQGKNANGNVFALLKQIRRDSRFDGYEVALALLPEKEDECSLKLQKYGIENVKFIRFASDDYLKALATSKYLITDNSFPAYFYKRPEQVYLNTWHGTPLKALGRTDIDNSISIANVQANMAKADYLLHPNRYTKDIMMSDYMMERVFKHKTVIIDYPRNDALYSPEFKEEITGRFGLASKRAIAYMPTWRGSGRDAGIEEQVKQTEAIISGIEQQLGENDVLFVNLHFLIGNRIDLKGREKVFEFPSEYEIYDFLAVCDTLITDYSSVSIDFAGTGKEIILFMYDYRQYERDKGFYTDIKAFPFKQAYTIAELGAALRSERNEYKLDRQFLCEDRGRSAERMIDLLCEGREEGLDIEDYSKKSDPPRIAFFENINRDESREKLAQIQNAAAGKMPVVMFPTAMTEETIATLKSLDRSLDFVRISGHLYCSNGEFRLLWAYKKFGIFKTIADKIYTREANRQMGQFRYEGIDVMQGRRSDRLQIISRL